MTKSERAALFVLMRRLFVVLSKTKNVKEQRRLEEKIRSISCELTKEDSNGSA